MFDAQIMLASCFRGVRFEKKRDYGPASRNEYISTNGRGFPKNNTRVHEDLCASNGHAHVGVCIYAKLSARPRFEHA